MKLRDLRLKKKIKVMWTLPPLESVPFSKDDVKSAKLTAVYTAV